MSFVKKIFDGFIGFFSTEVYDKAHRAEDGDEASTPPLPSNKPRELTDLGSIKILLEGEFQTDPLLGGVATDYREKLSNADLSPKYAFTVGMRNFAVSRCFQLSDNYIGYIAYRANEPPLLWTKKLVEGHYMCTSGFESEEYGEELAPEVDVILSDLESDGTIAGVTADISVIIRYCFTNNKAEHRNRSDAPTAESVDVSFSKKAEYHARRGDHYVTKKIMVSSGEGKFFAVIVIDDNEDSAFITAVGQMTAINADGTTKGYNFENMPLNRLNLRNLI